jgi:hypothetical protein
MKITKLETFVVDAGWRPWQFVAVRTDAGLTGYGECSDGRNPYGVVGAVRDFEAILVGQDPRPVERRYWDLYRMARQSPGGIAAPSRAWSWRCGTSRPRRSACRSTSSSAGRCATACGSTGRTAGPRALNAASIGVPPIRSLEDVFRLGGGRPPRLHRPRTNIVTPATRPASSRFGAARARTGT